jgi:DNA-binding response OmpR family regulator
MTTAAPSLNVLVVEDDDILRLAATRLLKERGHHATGVMCAEEVDDTVVEQPTDLYIINASLSGESGLSLAARVRMAEPLAGIILVSASGQLAMRLNGYEAGADIYLTKPVDLPEMIACVDALARRLKPLTMDGSLHLDPERYMLLGPAGECSLSRSETMLLAALARAQGRQLERWQAMRYVDPEDRGLSRANLEMRISALRKKADQVGAPSPSIRAIRGYGYKLCVPLKVRTG